MKAPIPTPTPTATPTPMVANLIQGQQESQECDSILEDSVRQWVFIKITRSGPVRVYSYNEMMAIRDELNAIFTMMHTKMNALLFDLEDGRDHA